MIPVVEINFLRCCGVKELHNISYIEGGPKEILLGALPGLPRVDTGAGEVFGLAFLMFSQADSPPNDRASYGDRLATYVVDHHMGEVTTMEATNPNTSNRLRVYLWKVNHPATMKWLDRAQRPSRKSKKPTRKAA